MQNHFKLKQTGGCFENPVQEAAYGFSMDWKGGKVANFQQVAGRNKALEFSQDAERIMQAVAKLQLFFTFPTAARLTIWAFEKLACTPVWYSV